LKLIDEKILQFVPSSATNGAGPKGFGWLVPDQLGMVNIEKAANIHDAHYYVLSRYKSAAIFNVASIASREGADKIFYKNLKIINKEMSPTWLGYQMRKPIIWAYYQAVKRFGKNFIK